MADGRKSVFRRNLIWRIAEKVKFGGNLIWRMAEKVNFGGNLIWRMAEKIKEEKEVNKRQCREH